MLDVQSKSLVRKYQQSVELTSTDGNGGLCTWSEGLACHTPVSTTVFFMNKVPELWRNWRPTCTWCGFEHAKCVLIPPKCFLNTFSLGFHISLNTESLSSTLSGNLVISVHGSHDKLANLHLQVSEYDLLLWNVSHIISLKKRQRKNWSVLDVCWKRNTVLSWLGQTRGVVLRLWCYFPVWVGKS